MGVSASRMDDMPLIPQVRKRLLLLIPSSLWNMAVQDDGTIFWFPFLRKPTFEMKWGREAAQTHSGGQNTGPDQIWPEIRAEQITASQFPKNTPANWSQGHSLPPLRAGNVPSSRDFPHPYIVHISWVTTAAYANMLTLMHRCRSWFAIRAQCLFVSSDRHRHGNAQRCLDCGKDERQPVQEAVKAVWCL